MNLAHDFTNVIELQTKIFILSDDKSLQNNSIIPVLI